MTFKKAEPHLVGDAQHTEYKVSKPVHHIIPDFEEPTKGEALQQSAKKEMTGKMHLGAPVVPHPDQVREVVEDKKRIVEAPPAEPDVTHAHGHSADVQIHEAKQQKMPSNVKGAPAKKVIVPYRESKAHKDEPLIDDEKLSLDMIHGKPIPL